MYSNQIKRSPSYCCQMLGTLPMLCITRLWLSRVPNVPSFLLLERIISREIHLLFLYFATLLLAPEILAHTCVQSWTEFQCKFRAVVVQCCAAWLSSATQFLSRGHFSWNEHVHFKTTLESIKATTTGSHIAAAIFTDPSWLLMDKAVGSPKLFNLEPHKLRVCLWS